MRLWSPRSIAGRLTFMNVVVSATALLLAYVAFLGYDMYTLRQDLMGSLSTEAAIVGANSVTALLFDDQQAAESTLAALNQSPHVLWAVIVRPDGASFAQYTRAVSIHPDLTRALLPAETHRTWMIGSNLLLGSRIMFEGKPVGAVYLLAETTALKQSALDFGLLSAGILLLCFAIALLITSTTRNLITAPLSGLAETAQIVSREKDYSVRAAMPGTTDELSFLVQSFNEMLEQIQVRDREVASARAVLEQRVQERTAELTAANKELEAFSYSVAHDLRGPLQHISNIAFLLQTMVDGSRSDERDLIDKLFDGSRRMSGLIDDLLNLSRATSTPLRRTAIDLGHMAQGILDGLKLEEPGRSVRIKIPRGVRAFADEGLLQVVLQNLLGNAWKYTSRKDPAEIELGFTDGAQGTVFFVCDNGAGFDARYSDRLFRPFQRLHSQSEFPGTGIGLATAARIIGRHGGKIWAESKVDQGATFFFTLPYDGGK
jgi:signal transduction histidine kinase